MSFRAGNSGSLLERLPRRARALRPVVLWAACGLIGLIVVVVASRQPRHQGKPVSFWIEELTGDDPAAAEQALSAIGAPAIPYLLNAVKTETSPTTSQLLENMTDVPLVGWLAEKLVEQRSRRQSIPDAAAEVLANLRQHANQMVPELVRIYQDPKRSEDVIERAAAVLEELGPDAASAMPSYLAHLREIGSTNKHLTVSILSAIGPPALEAVPLLSNLFNGEGWNDLLVAEALWNIDRRTNDTVQACLRILKSPNLQFNEGVARQALELLGRMGSAAREALLVLRDLFPKAPTPIRLQVELALRSIDAPTLDALYSDANRTARKQIERIVISLGTQDVWAPTPERTNLFRALLLIGALGPEAKSAQPRLVELLETLPAAGLKAADHNLQARIQSQAAQALGQIGDPSEAVVSALASGLNSANPGLARACCEALGRLGPGARAAVPALRQVTSEAESSFVRLAAAMALVDIAPDAGPTIVPVLREMEALPDWRVRNTAKIGRWKIEREGPSPIEELLSATSDSLFVQGSQRLPLNHSYLDTIKLLGWLGPEAKAALPELIGIVTTNSLTPLRLRAADAIRRIDPQTYHKLRLPGPLALPDTASE